MIENNYKKFKVLSINNEILNVLKKIIDNEYEVLKEFKNTKRNYVALYKVLEKKYVIKSPRNEFRIPQRKFFTLFKEGEAITTFKNINILIEKKEDYFAQPLGAITLKKNGMVIESHIVYEVLEGKDAFDNKELALEYTKKMHKNGIYHGDCNPSNFMITKDGLKIIDTQAKTMWFGNYRAHYDMLTLSIDSWQEMKYPYEKNIFYWLALGVKKSKRLIFVKKIKEFKKNLRDKGWKV